MEKAKRFSQMMRHLTLLTQLGFSLVTPLMICLGLCWWLTARFSLGGWVYIPGFFFGLGGSATTAVKMYQMITAADKKDQEAPDRPVSFNRHV